MPISKALWREVAAAADPADPDPAAAMWPLMRWVLDVPVNQPVAEWAAARLAADADLCRELNTFARRHRDRAVRSAFGAADPAELARSMRAVEHRARRRIPTSVPPPSVAVYDWKPVVVAAGLRSSSTSSSTSPDPARVWAAFATHALGIDPAAFLATAWRPGPARRDIAWRTLVAFVEQTPPPSPELVFLERNVWHPERFDACLARMKAAAQDATAAASGGAPVVAPEFWADIVADVPDDADPLTGLLPVWPAVLRRLALPRSRRYAAWTTPWKPDDPAAADRLLLRPRAQLRALGECLTARCRPPLRRTQRPLSSPPSDDDDVRDVRRRFLCFGGDHDPSVFPFLTENVPELLAVMYAAYVTHTGAPPRPFLTVTRSSAAAADRRGVKRRLQ
jgi:hypothetical protein